MTTWKGRDAVETSWGNNERSKYGTKSRDYMLGSFFETILTAILDPKDDKAIRIKTDPAYYTKAKYGVREQTTTNWKTRALVSN